MHDRNYPESVITEVLAEIFGRQVESTFIEGLVDSVSENDFLTKLESKKEEWSKIEIENPGVGAGFYEWFVQNKVEVIVSGMLRPVREDSGLGCPPALFTTNASESLNAVLKRL